MEQEQANTFETIAAAARRHGVHPKTIRRRIAEGVLTAYRCGPKLIRLDPRAVDALMRQIPTTSAVTRVVSAKDTTGADATAPPGQYGGLRH